MDEFLLLVHIRYLPERVVPSAHHRTLLTLWQAWVDHLEANGSLVTQPSHVDELGRVLTKGKPVAEGPYVEGGEAINSMLLIREADYEAATKIAQECPLLAVNGTVEVRRIL